jgi:hypothetical protein
LRTFECFPTKFRLNLTKIAEKVNVCDDGEADDGKDGMDQSVVQATTSMRKDKGPVAENAGTIEQSKRADGGDDDAVLDELLSMGSTTSSASPAVESIQPGAQGQVAVGGGGEGEEDDLEDWLDDVLG